MIPELDKLTYDELKQVGARVAELLKERDTERKEKAIAEARQIAEKAEAAQRAVLAVVGLPFSALASKKRRAPKGKGGKADAKPAKGKAA